MAHLPDAPVPSSMASLRSDDALALPRVSGQFVTEIHEGCVPAFAATALDHLHGSLFASLRHLQLCEAFSAATCTWVCYQQGEICGVLLFRLEPQRLLVLTEMVRLPQAQIEAFTHAVLARYPQVKTIVFNAVCVNAGVLAYPSLRYDFSENYILDLPDTAAAYLATLGKSTRKTIHSYGNRLRRDFPDLCWRAYEKDELAPAAQRALVLQLQAFKRASMAARHKEAAIDATDTRRLLQLASECGLFGIATVNGEVCAGSVACRIGAHYVMLLSAADPALENYRLGLLACYWSVCDCIARQARQCHLLWGRYQYKSQLQAVPHVLTRLTLYRSYRAMLAMPAEVFKIVVSGQLIRCHRWLLYDVHDNADCCSRLIAATVNTLRGWRRKQGSQKPEPLTPLETQHGKNSS